LTLKNYERFAEDYRALSSEFPESPLLSSLVLEEGFTQAQAGDPRAGDTLELFIHHFPRHPRQNEARLALAELALQDGDRDGVARYLQVVNASAPDAESAERAAYLAVFAADAETPPAQSKVVQLARQFIERFPRSTWLPEVRMKLGQIYFGTGDHANAETQFTLLAREDPKGPYAETALFLAGQSATKWFDPSAVDRALGLFDEVVKRDGPLKLYARQQQAFVLQGKLGKEDEAVTIYDAILSAQPPPDAELRSAALCGKGDSLTALGRTAPEQLEAAVAVFDFLATSPDVTPAWRNQALYKKGRALEKLKRQPEALTAYYDVLEKSAAEGREFFWYYKAGFDAAGLFEKQEDWKSAIGIYQKMAQLPGPRMAEAKAKLSELRLQKFIWD
jgi:tetratricopeptide (TPR) repeat protein